MVFQLCLLRQWLEPSRMGCTHGLLQPRACCRSMQKRSCSPHLHFPSCCMPCLRLQLLLKPSSCLPLPACCQQPQVGACLPQLPGPSTITFSSTSAYVVPVHLRLIHLLPPSPPPPLLPLPGGRNSLIGDRSALVAAPAHRLVTCQAS